MVLKRLSQALEDCDVVHAVLRGSAVNHDGSRSNGITAPSPMAQAEVIQAAWHDAGVTGADVGYIEAHGTGTRIGDPIEFKGLIQALAASPGTGPCMISSAKGNFGHLGGMAGLAGLIRIIAQFRAGQIFPTAHFRTPSPLLGPYHDAPLRIATATQDWPLPASGRRRAGISAFGLSGTNAHMVFEEPPAISLDQPDQDVRRLIPVSARSAAILPAHLRALRDALTDDLSLSSVADTLMFGREHFAHRQSYVTSSVSGLREELDRALDAGEVLAGQHGSTCPRVGLLLGDVIDLRPDEIAERCREFPAFAMVATRAEAIIPEAEWTPAQRHLVWLAGHHAVLDAFGIPVAVVLAHGAGRAAARVASGEADLAAAMRQADALQGGPAPDPARLRDAASSDGNLLLVDVTPVGALAAAVRALGRATLPVTPSLLEVLAGLYQAGFDLMWARGFGNRPARRVELPVAPLARERCWPRTAAAGALDNMAPGEVPEGAQSAGPTAGTRSGRSAEDIVLDFAREILKDPGLTLQDDFIDVGGNSLNGVQLVGRINDELGTDLDVLDLFETPDLAELGRLAGRGMTVRQGLGKPADAVTAAWQGPLSGQQTAIWAAAEMAGPGVYNVPAAVLLSPAADLAWLERRLMEIVHSQPMLRCALELADRGAVQIVQPPGPITVTRHQADLSTLTAAKGKPALAARLQELASRPLSPYGSPPVRFDLIQAHFADGPRSALLMTFHHLFFDGWSWRLVLAALSGSELPAPRRSYLDYIAHQHAFLDGEDGRELVAFWSQYLSDAPSLTWPAATPAGPAGRRRRRLAAAIL